MTADRLPPQDVDTEVACLASALLSRDALYKVTEILQPEDFYLDKHRIIFDSVLDLERKNVPLDLTTLKQRLYDQELFEKIGGDAALVELYQAAATSANAEFYAKRIKELSLRRKLIEVTSESTERCYDTTVETDELLDQIEQEIFKVTEKRITSDFQTIDVVLEETLEQIGHWFETKKVVTGIASGYKDLDEMLTGFHSDELIVMAARPGMGKTAIALNIMNNIALKDKKPVLFFSLEMPATQLGMRMLCIESMVDSQRVRTGHISTEELNKLFQISGKLGKAPIYLDDTPSISILEIRAKARRVHQKAPIGMIIIDYLQLITSRSSIARHEQVSEISRMLKQLARELRVPVIALSQLSRAVEARTDQIPTLSDLRESGAIEQDADVVMFIYREEKVKKDTEKKGIADIIVAKQRSGPVGTISLRFWEKYTKFGDLDITHSYEEASPSHEFD
ncbi:MAG: replicative DNA helicase [bacterium]|nr:replicative DNA helicase [bacterium]